MKASMYRLSLVLFATLLATTFVHPVPASATGQVLSLAEGKARLAEAHRILLVGAVDLERAHRGPGDADPLTTAVQRWDLQRMRQRLARVVALEKELISGRTVPGNEAWEELSSRVTKAHLAALRLRSEIESRSSAPEGVPAPGCVGSISGNVQGPGGAVVGAFVFAYIDDPDSSASAFTLTDSSGNYQIDDLPIGDYYVVTQNADGLVDEVYDDVECPGSVCDLTGGTAVTVNGGMTSSGVDFSLAAGGAIAGALSQGAIPLAFTTVNIFSATGDLVTSASSDAVGTYQTLTGLPSGNYYATTADIFLSSLDELYNDIPCPGGVSCDPTSGTPISVTAPNPTPNIDFDLAPGGSVAGTVTDSATALPIEGVIVGIHDSAGLLVSFGPTDPSGNYQSLVGLATANYYAVTGNFEGYVDENYNDIPCTGGICDPTAGTAIAVVAGVPTSGIDFALSEGGTFSGTITRDSNGAPISQAFVVAYSALGALIGTAETDANGDYTITTGLGTGSYRAATFNPYGFDDELYDDLPCPLATCDPTTGNPIAVTVGVNTPGIDFGLSGDDISACGFEDCTACDFDVVP